MTKFSEFPYVADRFNAVRRETVQVRVGEALIGGNAPILVQSMTTTKPKDVEKTVAETLWRSPRWGVAWFALPLRLLPMPRASKK